MMGKGIRAFSDDAKVKTISAIFDAKGKHTF